MPTFGLITEGVTDQQVLQAVLDGFFDPDEIDTRPFLPISDNTYKHQIQNFSNWLLVLDYCASPNFAEAFPFVDYIVVQIDTDQCDDPKFGVQKHEQGKLLPPEEIAARVAAKLQEKLARLSGTDFTNASFSRLPLIRLSAGYCPCTPQAKRNPKRSIV